MMKGNRKKMKRIMMAAVSVALLSGGCGAKMPELSEEQSKQVAEYAVGLLMKYDTHHESRLLSDVELERELARLEALAQRKAEVAAAEQARQEEIERQKAEAEQALADTPVIEQGESVPAGSYVDEFYGIDGITIRYQGYDVMDSYPPSGAETFFMMNASSGNKLLVLKFRAQNTTAESRELDMFSIMPRFKIGINGGSQRFALSTLLTDDLVNFKGVIEGNESETLVLIAEISEEMANNIESVSVSMQNETSSVTTLLD